MIVGLKAHVGRLTVKSLSASFDPSDARRGFHEFSIIKGFAANLTEEEIAALKKSPEVTYVEDDVERHAFSAGLHPAADAAAAQIVPYGINLVHAPQAWVGGRGATINVAVIDTGIDYHHPELSAIFAGGKNFVVTPNSEDPMDDNGHGTHCSGIIAASENSIGVVGVAPAVRLWGLKVLNASGSGTNSSVVKALDWLVQKKKEVGGNWVASLSLGGCEATLSDRNAFANATAAGVLVVAAVGNHDPTKPDICSNDDTISNSYNVSFPAAYPGVIAVAAVDSASKVATFSNLGPEVLLAAPGVDVLSTFPVGMGDTFGSVTPAGGSPMRSLPLEFAPSTSFNGPYVFCGTGATSDFPSSVKGKIALIRRGDRTFAEKVQNAKTAGAIGAVIFNNGADLFRGTLGDPAINWIPAVAITTADGQDLVDHPKGALSIVFGTQPDDYAIESGTSMACPHVAGVAATVWSIAPSATADAIKQALTSTAHDLGDPGPDKNYGNGLVDAEVAGKQLNPAAFDPKPTKPTGRTPGRRH